MACVENLASLPKAPLTLCGPGMYLPTRERKLRALRCYLALVPYLLPKDQSIRSSCLWHTDLHVDNIFVDPKEPTRIVSINDWQWSSLAPLFQHLRKPSLLDYEGTKLNGLERPRYPEEKDLAQMDHRAQEDAKALYLQKALAALYRFLIHTQYPLLDRALAFQEAEFFKLLLLPRELLFDGDAQYLARVAELQGSLMELSGVCEANNPRLAFQFSEQEIAEIMADAEAAIAGMDAMIELSETLGNLFPERGLVRHEHYEATKDLLRQLKSHVIEKFSKNEDDRKLWEDYWPFDS